MALLMWVPLSIPHFHSPSFTSHKHKHKSTTTTTTTLPKASLNINNHNHNHTNDVALLWFKHDLRFDDHPALVSSASQYHTVLPLYIFDHRIISRFSDETLQLVLLALKDLKTCLQNQGSNLMIRYGDAETIISKIVSESIDVFAEEEVEFNLRQMIGSVEECLANLSFPRGRGSTTQLILWQTPFYDIENLKKFPAFYSDFKKLNLNPTSPLATPVLPHLDINMDWGSIPTYDELRKYSMSVNSCESNEVWQSAKRISAKSVLSRGRINQVEMPNDVGEGSSNSNSHEGAQIDITFKGRRVNAENSVFLSREGTVVGGGTSVILNALGAYLRDLEGTSRGDWQEVHEKLRKAENRSGASFGALFRSALSLGILSRRRVYYEAIKYEKERNAGFLSPFGYSAATVAAAVETVCVMEWYQLLASKSHTDSGRINSVHTWRWKDYLIQYTALGQEGPAVLLVHGFGAFLEHYRDNMTPVSDGGNRVWAITLLGFGKSEKPNVVYTELMWAEMLRDFIIDVVGEPVHLVGNSIGGYFAAIVAGVWPSLARSIVLINTAGSVMPGNPSVLVNEERQISRAAWLGSRLLLFYLRLRLGNIVQNCYPRNRERVDDWLINEMLRASHDPGVLVVLESVFSFNLSIPLNYLFKSFGGKVLIIQGMKDPLSNSELKLSMLREQCNEIEIKELDAGHCPHDERPDEVNSIICEWTVNMENVQTC
ncbi:hypothetical protein AQUCO_01300654v1 [Aquilegia coerulea]|uniref:Photolyase/cryptochrome alpha/beta domain-containing protein n=1 Tax=Aquilegia coerulea TaxID=218851 RepID=A0A2G5E2S7_AQUCA|nr:hypothetical protein AQUCO_01300654v1 [Aquilegia coerulea]